MTWDCFFLRFLEVGILQTVHSISRYSAGIGGSNALHRKTLALLGEMVDDQLLALVQFDPDPDNDLSHALAMEAVMIPSDELVDAYFAAAAAENLMPQPTQVQGAKG
jgi:hypothetical protein